MKKTTRSRRNTGSKSTAKTVEEYLLRIPEPARSKLNTVRTIIRSVVPPETSEVISYGMPAFKTSNLRPKPSGVIVWYAAFAEHWSLFPSASVIERFRNELKAYRLSKGTIKFPLDEPPSAPLIRKLVKARLAQLWS
jgi:uncharacterized protein YdhG (YjbR/CyaY superfamily)